MNVNLLKVEIMAELLVAMNLYAYRLEKRSRFPVRLCLGTVLSLAMAWFLPMQTSPVRPSTELPGGLLVFLILFAMAMFVALLSYRASLQQALFCAMTGYTTQNLASSIRSIFSTILPQTLYARLNLVLYLMIYAGIYLSCFLLFSRRFRKNPEMKIDDKHLFPLCAIAVFIEIFLGLVEILSSPAAGASGEGMVRTLLIHAYNLFACVFILYIEQQLMINHSLETDMVVMNELLREEKKQYQLSKDTIQLINLKCHDLKHQIRRLRSHQSAIDPAELGEIENAVGIYDSVVRTGNDALDVILSEKSLVCEKNEIHLTCMAQKDCLAFMSAADVYSLFGNAMDNAIEAVSALPDPALRNISINMRTQAGLVLIHVENNFAGGFVMEDGLPHTTKGSTDYHGFGMKSMRRIVEKYEGVLSVKAQDQIFHLIISIPIPEKEGAAA